ncbi:unnamed protein product [Meloidogyne enterolobii]|uniref:Uncharacterized protein n=1 Tax=Meloidogyne enterolobii TaxID=390850 RepID=A0ACB0YV77_MELEN
MILHEQKINLNQGHVNDKTFDEIKKILDEKMKEKCGGKWEINGNIYFGELEGKTFYLKLLEMTKQIFEKIKNEKNILQQVEENKIFNELIEMPDKIGEEKYQNFNMFWDKYGMILLDFSQELADRLCCIL